MAAKYDHINFKPTESMASAAKRGLEMREKQAPSNRGMTPVGLARARQLIAREELSPSTVKRMYSFFSRHEVDKSSASWKEGNSKGEQAWLAWGGDAGYSWSRKVVKQMEAADGKKNSLEVNRIEKKDGEYCVVSEDGSRSFGCYKTEGEAKKRLGQVEYFKEEKMNSLLVNVTSKVNRASIRRDTRNGDEFVIISSATLPDGVVMNGGLYPAEEIEKSYQTLERSIAPLEHPQDSNGNFISAKDPDAIDNFYVGARNENVRRENGRVFVDKAINVRMAMNSEKGKRLMDRIKSLEKGNGEPIHTSTGVFLQAEELDEPMVANEGPSAGEEYTWIARNMEFDHDAILLDEPGAATPEQGVGIAVNSKQKFTVCHAIVDGIEDKEDPAPEDKGFMDKLKSALKTLGFAGNSDDAYNSDSEYSHNSEDDPMKVSQMVDALKKANLYKDNMDDDAVKNAYDDMMKKEKKNGDEDGDGAKDQNMKKNSDQSAQIAALTDSVAKLTDLVEGLQANQNQEVQARRKELTETVVNSDQGWTEDDLKDMPEGALQKLAANCSQGEAYHLGTHFKGNHSDKDAFNYADMEAPSHGA